jgi:3-dehydroquinate synthase
MASDLTAKVTRNATGFDVRVRWFPPSLHVDFKSDFTAQGIEDINYKFEILDDVFNPSSNALSAYYTKWGRVLVVIDEVVHGLYGARIRAYFNAHNLPPTFKVIKGGELNKTMETMLSIVDAMDEFGLVRKEPVLVVGGGLVTDVAGYACASYRRSSNFIRVPTTLIGLIDASVSIKVGLNWRKFKNRYVPSTSSTRAALSDTISCLPQAGRVPCPARHLPRFYFPQDAPGRPGPQWLRRARQDLRCR